MVNTFVLAIIIRIHLWWILLYWPLLMFLFFFFLLLFRWLWPQNSQKNHACSPSQKTQIWPNFFDLDLIFKVTEVIKVKILKISKFNILLNLEYFWKPFWVQGCTLVLQVSDRYWLKLITGNFTVRCIAMINKTTKWCTQ